MSTTEPWRRQTLGDLLHRSAARHPHKLAIACGPVRWTYREFDALCDRLAAGLAQQGIAKGDRVAILARNSHAFAALRFALARLGAVLVPINFMLKAEEAAYILRHAGARLLATDSGLAAAGPGRGSAGHGRAAVPVAAGRRRRREPVPGMLRFDDTGGLRRRRRPRWRWTAATWRRSSTPAAPSRCPRARCSRTTR